MESLTIEYDVQNPAIKQSLNELLTVGVFQLKDREDEFDRDTRRAISGDELINRLSNKIYKMFENESALLTGS